MTESAVQGRPFAPRQVMFDCDGNLATYVDVKIYPPGAAITITDPIVSGSLTDVSTYSLPPRSPNVVVVRLFYQWPLFVTGLGFKSGESHRQQASV